VVIITCPLTPQTRGMVDGAALAAMKPSAFLINVSRGPIVNEPDLIAAITRGRIAGAGLDVVSTEPLPPESPLWDLPGVIVTPHMAWSSPLLEGRLADLIAANYERYVRGQPLLNLVDKHAGY
jgi:phosphoglycerate dehydrogenase-like enzyme